MIRLRLFHRDDPGNQIESRTLDEGELVLGRGAQADWTVADPDRGLSRQHFAIASRGGMLTVKDTSANGVFLGTPRQRVERDRAVPVSRGEAIHFGHYILIAEEDRGDGRAGAAIESERPDPGSPFGAPAGAEREADPAKRRDPFGSALKPDPVALDADPGDGVDAWERKREFRAGDWDPVAPHRRADHAQLIGTPQQWPEPPPPPERESGLGFDAPFTSPILREPDPVAGTMAIPNDWDAPATDQGSAPQPPAEPLSSIPPPTAIDPDPILPVVPLQAPAPAPPAPPPPIAPAIDDAALFASFCAGARLSPAAFAGEDQAQLMERLGAVYRQAILGVADLMSERTALKNDFRMVRTTIRPEGNNPFKWVPPQRLAVELLRQEDGSGYSTGERALNEALHDVKAHMLCMLAGMRAALGATFDLLAPSEMDRRIAGRNFVMPGQRGAAAWNEYVELFATLRREADDSAEGPINRAFREAYEAQLKQLDGRGANGGR